MSWFVVGALPSSPGIVGADIGFSPHIDVQCRSPARSVRAPGFWYHCNRKQGEKRLFTPIRVATNFTFWGIFFTRLNTAVFYFNLLIFLVVFDVHLGLNPNYCTQCIPTDRESTCLNTALIWTIHYRLSLTRDLGLFRYVKNPRHHPMWCDSSHC